MTMGAATLLTLVACDPTEPDDNNEGGGLNSDAIVLAYVTHYTNKMPMSSAVTHINYAFAELYIQGGVYKGFKLQGSESTFQKVMNLKDRYPELKILLSFTNLVENPDNKIDGGFSALAANEKYRKQFAKDCVDFMRRWRLDGIDIDWEFPGVGWSGAATDPVNDMHNYTLLMRDLRAAFGNDYLLTFAGYCRDKVKTGEGWRYIDIAAVEPYVDYVCVMTYDLDEAPHPHSALTSPSSYWDISRMVSSYKSAGFPMRKIVLGIPFYARHAFSGANATVAYNKLSTLGAGYKIDNWDSEAKVPYITYNGEFWGSYDNARSIEFKAEFAARQGLGGLFYWCVTQDDNSYTLSTATWESVKKYF